MKKIKKIIILLSFIMSLHCFKIVKATNEYETMLEKVDTLEQLCKEYSLQNSKYKDNYDILMYIYIRESRYNSKEWNTLAGERIDDFENFIKEKDSSLSSLKNLNTLELPNGEIIDFVHMFASMNMIENKHEILGSWGGDIVELASELTIYEDNLETLIPIAKNTIDTTYSQFNHMDMMADLDSWNLYYLRQQNNQKWSEIIKNYYKNLTNEKRIQTFLEYTYDNNYDREEMVEYYCKEFNKVKLIPLLSENLNIPKNSKNYIKASIYAFANYLYENSDSKELKSLPFQETSVKQVDKNIFWMLIEKYKLYITIGIISFISFIIFYFKNKRKKNPI